MSAASSLNVERSWDSNVNKGDEESDVHENKKQFIAHLTNQQFSTNIPQSSVVYSTEPDSLVKVQHFHSLSRRFQ